MRSHEKRGLPPAFWAYWALLVASCALEFCILFWAPAFLEQVVGFAPASAAMAAAGFPLGMLLGRIALARLVRRVPLRRLLIAHAGHRPCRVSRLLGFQPAGDCRRGRVRHRARRGAALSAVGAISPSAPRR